MVAGRKVSPQDHHSGSAPETPRARVNHRKGKPLPSRARSFPGQHAGRRWNQYQFVLAFLLILATLLVTTYRHAPTLPFVNDDYCFLDKVSSQSFPELWQRQELLFGWYRPWSREFHYWTLYHLFDTNEAVYHLVSFALWGTVMVLFFVLVWRLAGAVVATIAAAGVATLGLWSALLVWVAGAQDLWMLLWSLVFLHCLARRWHVTAIAALALALLSKETAAVLPAVAVCFLFLVERRSPREVLIRTAPLWLVLGTWAVIHPSLVPMIGKSSPVAADIASRPDRTAAALKTLFSQFNLEAPLAPWAGWSRAALAGAAAAILLGGFVFLAYKNKEHEPERLVQHSKRRALVVFGIAWAGLGWLPVLSPSLGWHAYYGSLGSLGFWFALAILLQDHRRTAIAIVAVLALLRQARAATPSEDWGTEWYQVRAGMTLARIREQLFQLHPTLPPHSRLHFAQMPPHIGFLAGDGPSVRIWYKDPTLRAQYFSAFAPRTPDAP